MEKPLQVGVIGCGDIAVTQHLPAIVASNQVVLRAVCDKDRRRAESCATRYGAEHVSTDYTEVLADDAIEAVIIATPPWVTPTITMEALEAGKHVLCEKPMALDVATARDVVETEARTGKKVQVGFIFRHLPVLKALKEWVDSGQLGHPLVYRIGIFDETWDPVHEPEHHQRIMETMRHGSPMIHDGAHMVDLIHYFTGSTVTEINALGLRSQPEYPATNYDVALLQMENGDAVKLEVGWFYPRLPDGEFEVLGPNGMATYDLPRGEVRLLAGSVTHSIAVEGAWQPVAFAAQLAAFVRSIRLDLPCAPGSTDGLRSLQITLQVKAAIGGHQEPRNGTYTTDLV